MAVVKKSVSKSKPKPKRKYKAAAKVVAKAAVRNAVGSRKASLGSLTTNTGKGKIVNRSKKIVAAAKKYKSSKK
jgi:hypothetical protein